MHRCSRVSENTVEAAVCRFMLARGWRRRRNHVGVFTGPGGQRVTVGTPGEPDFSFYRTISRGTVQVCHIEVKRPGGKPTQKQLERIAQLNHLGEPAVWVDSVESLQEWYEQQNYVAQ